MFEEEFRLFAEVILPLAAPQNYMYGIPQELEATAAIGKRVEIQFGKKKIFAGVIKNIHSQKPIDYKIKPVISVLDDKAVVNDLQLRFWEWMSDYYLCTEGEVLNAALPAGFKLESETSIILAADFNHDYSSLNDKEYLVAEALSLQHELKVEDIQNILGIKSVYAVLQSLMNKKIVFVKEKLVEKFKPRTETFVKLNEKLATDDELKKLFETLKRAPKQEALLLSFLHFKHSGLLKHGWISKSELLKKSNSSEGNFTGLVEKEIFISEKKVVDRLHDENENEIFSFDFSEKQKIAFDEIEKHFAEHEVVLLHGITGSGKTNLYVKQIEKVIAEGKQVLFMVPEISLTTQITNRLKKYFGNNIGVYHSKFNQNERVEIWNKLLNNEYKIVLGARSALFLPFSNLGLIIVDEEHDTSYKQQEPTPRYHARDCAIYLATQHNAKVLLGTATPSFESYFNAANNKYGLVELNERFGNTELPEILIADTKEERKRKTMHSHFSSMLLDEMELSLNANEQVILFQNRRGYSPFTECALCGFVPQCPNCDVNLTYHKFHNELRCHYCGYRKPPLKKCPACGSQQLEIQGFGTEKIEDEVQALFKEKKVARMDLDSIRTKQGHNKLIHEFENEKFQILVGTQMVTKGLDFGNVSLVGVMSADQLVNNANFRANERAYQLIEQVRGRAGRKQKRGKVVIQTMNPKYAVLEYLLLDDFKQFYTAEMLHRQQFNYPPYTRLVSITLKNKDKKKLDEAAAFFAYELKTLMGKRVLGPAEPSISKIQNFYLSNILLKLEKTSHILKQAKQKISDTSFKLAAQFDIRNTVVEIDVDPY